MIPSGKKFFSPPTFTVHSLAASWAMIVNSSDASELSLARLSSDSAQAGGLSARLGSALEISEPARLATLSSYEPKLTL